MLSHQCASPPGSHLVPEGLVKAKATRASDRWSSRGVGTLDVVADLPLPPNLIQASWLGKLSVALAEPSKLQ